MGEQFICHKCEQVINEPFAMEIVDGYRKYFHLACAVGMKGAKQIYIGQPFDEATREAEEWGICPKCDGSGEVAGDYFGEDGMRTCTRCGGMGTL